METGKKPVFKQRLGRTSIAVWANARKNGEGEFYSVSFSRSYTKEDGSRGDTATLNADDLPAVQYLAGQALRFIEEAKRPVESAA